MYEIVDFVELDDRCKTAELFTKNITEFGEYDKFIERLNGDEDTNTVFNDLIITAFSDLNHILAQLLKNVLSRWPGGLIPKGAYSFVPSIESAESVLKLIFGHEQLTKNITRKHTAIKLLGLLRKVGAEDAKHIVYVIAKHMTQAVFGRQNDRLDGYLYFFLTANSDSWELIKSEPEQ